MPVSSAKPLGMSPERAAWYLAAIVNSSDDAIVTKTLQGIITSWNAAAERIFGYTAAEAIGRSITIIIPPDRQAEEEMVLSRISQGQWVDHFETVRVTKAGRLIDISLTVSPVRDPQGRIIGASKIARDITVRKQAEAALQRVHAELEQRVVERTAALTATVQDLQREIQRRTQAEEHLRQLSLELTLTEQRERQRIAHLLHDGLQQLLVAAQLRTAMLERTAGPAVLASVREQRQLLQEALQTSRSLTTELNPAVLHARGLFPALQWLAKWMEETHQLAVDLKVEAADGPDNQAVTAFLFQATRELLFNVVKHAGVNRARVEVTLPGTAIQVEVSDAGRGFDPTQVETGPHAGGLGLASIRQRVEFLGGSLQTETGTGHGTRFTIRIPLRHDRHTPRIGAPAAEVKAAA